MPIVIVGLAFKDILEGALTKDLHLIGKASTGVAALLWIAERVSFIHAHHIRSHDSKDAIAVRAAQCLALIPVVLAAGP
ncbi:MAG: hypothetical protein IPM83_15740 [Ignavibacteria bacterium]|nr:hypothetical protein [Ignavibacteria bacterium]